MAKSARDTLIDDLELSANAAAWVRSLAVTTVGALLDLPTLSPPDELIEEEIGAHLDELGLEYDGEVVAPPSAAEAPPLTTVIFACVHNAGRSQMAAALFNRLAAPEAARAISAGTNPGEHVHPEVLTVMREIGIDLAEARPQRLTPTLAERAQVLITMGCGDECKVVPGTRRDDWPLPDPKGQPLERVRQIRDEVQARVKILVAAEGWER